MNPFEWTNPVIEGGLALLALLAALLALVIGMRAARPARGSLPRRTSASQGAAPDFKRLALEDPLTGLPNRRALIAEIEQRQRSGTGFCLALIDLDDFKTVNDTRGHGAGDSVLRTVADSLRNRRISGHPHPITIARLGGDEFVALAPGLTTPAQAKALGSRLRRAIAHAGVTGSIGLALCAQTNARPPRAEDLIALADSAMFRAKSTGGDASTLAQPGTPAPSARAAALAASLPQALTESALTCRFLPQVDARTGRIAALTLLPCWHHPSFGKICQADLFSAAETAGCTGPLLDALLLPALTEPALPAKTRLCLSLPLPAVARPQTEAILARLIARTGTAPQRLTIAVTSQSPLRKPAIDALTRLKDRGLHIALTGIGAGHMPLATMTSAPFDALHLAASATPLFASDPAARALLAATLAIAKSTGAQTLAPGNMARVFYQSSGSEANETQIKLAWYYNNAKGRPEKKKIISRVKGYHGVTIVSASMTGLPYNHKDFDLPVDRILHTSTPHYWREGQPGESEAEFIARLAADLTALIEKEGPETIAAFIAEPVMGAGGVIVPPKDYFPAIMPILKEHDILCIADEVICGFGRTGNWFGAQSFGMEPTSMSMAKQLTGGFIPLSAVAINRDMAEAIEDNAEAIGTFGHGFTYGGHPVGCAVGIKALEIYERDNIPARVAALAPTFARHLDEIAASHPLVGEARHAGLMGALELSPDKSNRPFATPGKLGPLVAGELLKEGVIVRPIVDAIAFCPPMIATEDDLAEIFAATRAALDRALDKARADNLLQ